MPATAINEDASAAHETALVSQLVVSLAARNRPTPASYDHEPARPLRAVRESRVLRLPRSSMLGRAPACMSPRQLPVKLSDALSEGGVQYRPLIPAGSKQAR